MKEKIHSYSVQRRQRQSQGQAQPEGARGRPEVKEVTGPIVWARGHDPEEEHHWEETAQTNRQIKQCGG